MNAARWLLLALLLLSPAAANPAQEAPPQNEAPLAQMLSFVPNVPRVWEDFIAYADWGAAAEARGVPALTSAADLEDDDLRQAWIGSVGAMNTLPRFRDFIFFGAQQLPEVSGFALPDIERTLYFGEPPSIGHVLMGEFSTESIDAALSQRDFEIVEQTEQMTLWCWVQGCDQGQMMDFEGRFPGSELFGGDFGRREPRALLDETLLANSADDTLLQIMLSAYEGDFPSLMDNRTYAAIVHTATARDGLLRQVMFVPLGVQTLDVARLLGLSASPEAVAALRDELIPEDYEPLPPYEALALVDIAEGDTEYSHVLLVFDDADDAQVTGEGILRQLHEGRSFFAQQPYTEMIAARGGTVQPLEVLVDEDTGKAIAVLTVTNPLPTEFGEDRSRWSGRLYALLLGMIYDRDVLWLSTNIAGDE